MSELERLATRLREAGPIAIAVSGGIDSMTLAYVAHRTSPGTRMYHALSPAVPTQATDRVKHYAAIENWSLALIDAGEIADPRYTSNPVNRCYFCKTNLYDTVVANTSLPVASGTNTDDLGDYRPGLIAADEHRVRHPFVEAGIDKRGIRSIASELGLDDLKDLPASPCLSSRITTGIAIDPALLPVINEIEQRLWTLVPVALSPTSIRCRIRPNEVALEIETTCDIDEDAVWAIAARDMTADQLIKADFRDLAHRIVIEPYRRGSAFLVDAVEVMA